MRDAGIDDLHDVHFVQIKCPLLTTERVEAALHRGHKTVTTSAYTSMGYSRGASALGVARAFGEIKEFDKTKFEELGTVFVGRLRFRRHRADAQRRDRHGQFAHAATSPFVIGHALMRDAIDLSAVIEALKSVGLGLADERAPDRLVNIFAKAEASPDGRCAVSATPCSTIPM